MNFTRTSSVPIEAEVLVLHLVLLAVGVMGVQLLDAQPAARTQQLSPEMSQNNTSTQDHPVARHATRPLLPEISRTGDEGLEVSWSVPRILFV